ncbi:MAG: o-succinylbenzoate synthase [Anaerolineae bacterium]
MINIEQAALHLIAMPLVSPFETSFGRQTVRQAILVELRTPSGAGWGECVAGDAPAYSYETTDTAWSVLSQYLVPAVLAQPFDSLPALHERWAWMRGHNMARAAVEQAAAALLAADADQSLATFLGGERTSVPVGVSVGIQATPEALVDTVAGYLAQGYGRIKLKIKPGKDIAFVEAVRRAYPAVLLQVDANSAYTLADSERLRQLDDFNLLLIEQPLDHDDIYEHSLLQRQLRTPICLDESIHTLLHARAALALSACRIINIKVGRVGGLIPARQIHDLCQAHGVPVWCGGMLETGVGRAANLALASLPNFRLPGDISASSRYYTADIAEPTFSLNPDSTISVPTAPGLGVIVNREALLRVTLHSATFAPA